MYCTGMSFLLPLFAMLFSFEVWPFCVFSWCWALGCILQLCSVNKIIFSDPQAIAKSRSPCSSRTEPPSNVSMETLAGNILVSLVGATTTAHHLRHQETEPSKFHAIGRNRVATNAALHSNRTLMMNPSSIARSLRLRGTSPASIARTNFMKPQSGFDWKPMRRNVGTR